MEALFLLKFSLNILVYQVILQEFDLEQVFQDPIYLALFLMKLSSNLSLYLVQQSLFQLMISLNLLVYQVNLKEFELFKVFKDPIYLVLLRFCPILHFQAQVWVLDLYQHRVILQLKKYQDEMKKQLFRVKGLILNVSFLCFLSTKFFHLKI